jgi:hypothetical protein
MLPLLLLLLYPSVLGKLAAETPSVNSLVKRNCAKYLPKLGPACLLLLLLLSAVIYLSVRVREPETVVHCAY